MLGNTSPSPPRKGLLLAADDDGDTDTVADLLEDIEENYRSHDRQGAGASPAAGVFQPFEFERAQVDAGIAVDRQYPLLVADTNARLTPEGDRPPESASSARVW